MAGFFISVFLTVWQFMRSMPCSGGTTQNTETLEAIITQPLVALLRSEPFNDIALAILFGLVGLVCYTIIEILIGIYHSYNNQKTLVHFEGKNEVSNRRPAAVMLGDWMWRLMIIAGLIIFTFISMRLFSAVTSLDLLAEQPIFLRFVVNVAMYMLILHVYLVFLRLYVRRTRLFEELLF